MNFTVCCPYFYPLERTHEIAWPFPHRLPLGCGFRGLCRAAGENEFVPEDATLRDSCNMGHARGCERLPLTRIADSVRLAVVQDTGDRILLLYAYDLSHAPVAHGQLAYDCVANRWISTVDDICVQRQAECYLRVYLDQRPRVSFSS